MSEIQRRYDFALVFDVQDGNPNGDPDAGNLPRIDPETGHGIVTDVCLKRKIRNYVLLTRLATQGFDIYVKEKAVLGRAHVSAFKKLGIETGQESRKPVHGDVAVALAEVEFPDGVLFEQGDEEGTGQLVIQSDVDKKEINAWLKEADLSKTAVQFIRSALKEAKPRKPSAEETERGRAEMCKDFFDIRTFGAVMSLKSAPNCGQVRGPVQLTFGRSVDPIVTLEHSITRMAVATEAEAEKQSGDNRTMGRKNTVPYGIYVAHGFVSPFLAAQTGFSEEDLALLWEALANMFEHDRSAARGLMSTRKLVVFEHEKPLGCAPAHALFDRVNVRKKDSSAPARSYSDYEVKVDESDLPAGVTVQSKV